jgi:hypothetical protein
MDIHGNLDVQQNKILSSGVKEEASLPVEGFKKGRIAFVNKVLQVCVSILGTPIWVPLTNTLNSFTYENNDGAMEWNITHNLATESFIHSIFDEYGENILPDSVKIIDANNVKVTFNRNQKGVCLIVASSALGSGFKSLSSKEFTQNAPLEVWTIHHRLGVYPIVDVFVNNRTFIPEYVKHLDKHSVEIGFSEPTSGVARFI